MRPVLTVKLEAGGVSLTAVSMLVSSPAERLHFHFGTTDGRLAYLKQNLVQVGAVTSFPPLQLFTLIPPLQLFTLIPTAISGGRLERIEGSVALLCSCMETW